MKKVLLTLTLAAFAFAANAQLVIGGNLGFSTDNNTTNFTNVLGNTTTEATVPGYMYDWYTNLTIMPKIGYQLNDKMQAGLAFGLTWNSDKDYTAYAAEYATIDGFEGWDKTTGMSVGLTPYFRYNLAEVGDFSIFCEAQLGFTFGLNPTVHYYHNAYTDPVLGKISELDEDRKGIEETSTNIALSVVPGLNYKLGDHFSIDVYANVLRLGFEYSSSRYFRDNNVVAGISGAPTSTNEQITNSTEFGLSAGRTGAISIGLNYAF
ncbi:MAG: hypothetical protein J6W88_02680 [Bacteroidales bacterium]|nr:hypothetical protein [Bacteroidales bacterium]